MEERDFFDERTEKKMATLNCPHCHQPAEYEVTWIVRTKKRQLPGRGDERDRARFAKARSYMLRKDDLMGCKNAATVAAPAKQGRSRRSSCREPRAASQQDRDQLPLACCSGSPKRGR